MLHVHSASETMWAVCEVWNGKAENINRERCKKMRGTSIVLWFVSTKPTNRFLPCESTGTCICSFCVCVYANSLWNLIYRMKPINGLRNYHSTNTHKKYVPPPPPPTITSVLLLLLHCESRIDRGIDTSGGLPCRGLPHGCKVRMGHGLLGRQALLMIIS